MTHSFQWDDYLNHNHILVYASIRPCFDSVLKVYLEKSAKKTHFYHVIISTVLKTIELDKEFVLNNLIGGGYLI